ncbi:MAG: oligopeptide/dipeptide transporter, ATPase subunit, partial [Clostridia bacterium]|nr:oligopeptide/dipeptide transporter, ATPase subunit [Clostridia bacterium]
MDKNDKKLTARQIFNKVSKDNSIKVREFTKKNKRILSINECKTQMKDTNNIIEFENLKTYFFTDIGTVKAVDGVSFNIPRGKTVGVVGESGCGKSVTSLSLMRLVQPPAGFIVDGQIRYARQGGAVDIAKLPISEMQKIRGNEIAMIFQEPMTSLNPVFSIGYKLDETI